MAVSILTVDDSKALRLFVQKSLSAYDCELDEASNGFNGLFAIQRHYPDLVLLDVVMPVMGGIDMLERIKKTPELKKIRVIMMASPGDHAYIEEIKREGADEILMKPFTAAALLEKIQSILPLKPKK